MPSFATIREWVGFAADCVVLGVFAFLSTTALLAGFQIRQRRKRHG